MYEWQNEYAEGQTRATCSKCGVPYRWPDEIKKLDDGFYYCLRTCIEQTVKSRDKMIAQSRRRRELPPPKFVIAPRYVEDYFTGEDAVFKTVILGLPSATDPTEIGWGVRYLCDLVLENRRPARWIIDAKRVIADRCNFLLTLQYGAPLGPAPAVTSTKVRYGGFADGANLYTSIAIVCGAALAKAYSILGTVAYLDAAVRAGHFLRHMQCQDLDNNGNGTTYGGSPYHVGGFAEGVSASSTIVWISNYNVFDIAGVWFLDLLSRLQGGSTVYGGAAGTDFTASTAATLDTMIDEAVNFATIGAKDIGYGGALTTGLSTTYPRSVYCAISPTAGTNTGTWSMSAYGGLPVLVGRDLALALFALDAAGEGTDTVNAVFDWLMTFSANPANAAPTEDAQLLIGNLKGTYDPTVALAAYLDVSPNQDHAGAGYDWLAAGLLAPIASVRLPVAFTAAKETLENPQPSLRGPQPANRYIGESGHSGLSLQWAAS